MDPSNLRDADDSDGEELHAKYVVGRHIQSDGRIGERPIFIHVDRIRELDERELEQMSYVKLRYHIALQPDALPSVNAEANWSHRNDHIPHVPNSDGKFVANTQQTEDGFVEDVLADAPEQRESPRGRGDADAPMGDPIDPYVEEQGFHDNMRVRSEACLPDEQAAAVDEESGDDFPPSNRDVERAAECVETMRILAAKLNAFEIMNSIEALKAKPT